MKLLLLNLFVGTTVPCNTVAMPGGHVVIDEDGTLEVRLSRSPATAGTTPSKGPAPITCS